MKNRFSVRMTDATMLAAVVIAVLAAYWPAVHNGFVWDDRLYLFDVEMFDPVLWRQKISEPFAISSNYFRPLPLATFIAQIQAHGANAYAFHLVNLLLHALNTFLVGFLALHAGRHLGKNEKSGWIAGLAALVYGLHPANIESVAWVSGRFDLMVTSFLLLALVADTVLEKRLWLRATSVGLCYLGAAASKEMALVFPLVMFAWHLARHPRPLFPLRGLLASLVKRGELQVYGAIVAGGLTYLAWRLLAMGYIYKPLKIDAFVDSGLGRLLIIMKSLGWYLLTTIYPFTSISPVHPRPFPFLLTDRWAWIAVVAVAAMLALLVWFVRKQPRQGWMWVACVAAFLPVIHIIPMTIGDNFVHDRFMVFPLALFAVALTASLSMLLAKPRAHAKALRWGSAIVLLFLAGGGLANIRVGVLLWHDNLTLWTWATVQHPESATAHANLADELTHIGRDEEAAAEGIKAIEILPFLPGPWTIVGNALADMGNYEEAIIYQDVALSIAPDAHEVMNNKALALIWLHRYKEAETVLLKAREKHEYNRRINSNLGVAYTRMGKKDVAAKYFEIATSHMTESEREYHWKSVNRYLSQLDATKPKKTGAAATTAPAVSGAAAPAAPAAPQTTTSPAAQTP
jgi:tetratricopeptide (TPR) repeat protein